MNAVEMIAQKCSDTGTGLLLGLALASKRSGLPIWNFMSIDEIGRIDMSLIDPIRDENGQGDSL